MFAKKNILSASLFFLFTVNSYAGFGLETTRLVYNEKIKAKVLLLLILIRTGIIYCNPGLKMQTAMSALTLSPRHLY